MVWGGFEWVQYFKVGHNLIETRASHIYIRFTILIIAIHVHKKVFFFSVDVDNYKRFLVLNTCTRIKNKKATNLYLIPNLETRLLFAF